MARAVGRWPLTAEARVPARVSLCGTVGKVVLGHVSILALLLPPVTIIRPWLSILIYHLGDEVSHNRHLQQQLSEVSSTLSQSECVSECK
jgi:hypothetical protein